MSSCPAGEAQTQERSSPAGVPPHSNVRPGNDEESLRAELVRAVSSGPAGGEEPTAILLVSHGSRAPGWRRMLLDVHAETAEELLALPGVCEVRSAFMEYTEPSIATQLRAFDEAGIGSVIVIPLLLTISDHSFDDIPTICGLADDPERIAELEGERIEIYPARATLHFAPLLDFSGLVRRNLARRVRAILGRPQGGNGSRPANGLVLIGYGSAEFDDEWNRFFTEIRNYAESELGFAATAHGWCGHLVDYRRQPTIDAIESVLARADRAVVVPILVAHDPMFQDRVIGRAVERCPHPERVLYRPDSILPEPEVGRWVIEIAGRMLETASGSRAAAG